MSKLDSVSDGDERSGEMKQGWGGGVPDGAVREGFTEKIAFQQREGGEKTSHASVRSKKSC